MDGHGLPVDVLRLVLQALLGEKRLEGYRLLRQLQDFSLVCKTWREAVLTTPLRLTIDYLPELKWQAVRWLLKATFADLQVHPNFHINRLLTNPDFAQRNRHTLQRVWGAQLVGPPARWPQWRHFPQLHTLELNCDGQALALQQPQFFESRVLAPLTQLKHLSLQEFSGADLTRLPPSLKTLHAGLDFITPLALPPDLKLEELNLATCRLLVDWAQLCSQVEQLIVIEAACIDLLASSEGGSIFRQAAAGFRQGIVQEIELVAQEVSLVRLQGPLPKHIPEDAYHPEVLESVHLVTLAADFQTNDFRHFGCIYNPDDLQSNEEIGMTDGMTVHLHRYKPEKQVLGFSYGLSDEQVSYLLSEAQVEGFALEAVEEGDLTRVLNSQEFQQRCGASLRWLQGLDLLGHLELQAFPQLQRLEGYILSEPASTEAVSRLPAGLTSLDLCGVPKEEDDPTTTSSWPAFINRPAQPGCPCISHLTQLQDLSLRHFREVDLTQGTPASLESITIECPRPKLTKYGGAGAETRTMGDLLGAARQCDCPTCLGRLTDAQLLQARLAQRFDFKLPPLPPGQERMLTIQLHRNEDYYLRCPILFLNQLLGCATRVVISVTSDPPAEPAAELDGDGEEDDGEGMAEGGGNGGAGPMAVLGGAALVGAALAGAAHGQQDGAAGQDGAAAAADSDPRPTTLLLAAGHETLRQALEELTASSLQSIEVNAGEVLFTDASGSSYTDSRRVIDYIKRDFGADWLVWSHDPPPHPDEEDEMDEEAPAGSAARRKGGGFTMRRK